MSSLFVITFTSVQLQKKTKLAIKFPCKLYFRLEEQQTDKRHHKPIENILLKNCSLTCSTLFVRIYFLKTELGIVCCCHFFVEGTGKLSYLTKLFLSQQVLITSIICSIFEKNYFVSFNSVFNTIDYYCSTRLPDV
jgi:hypothetical protein